MLPLEMLTFNILEVQKEGDVQRTLAVVFGKW